MCIQGWCCKILPPANVATDTVVCVNYTLILCTTEAANTVFLRVQPCVKRHVAVSTHIGEDFTASDLSNLKRESSLRGRLSGYRRAGWAFSFRMQNLLMLLAQGQEDVTVVGPAGCAIGLTHTMLPVPHEGIHRKRVFPNKRIY